MRQGSGDGSAGEGQQIPTVRTAADVPACPDRGVVALEPGAIPGSAYCGIGIEFRASHPSDSF
jgi:hypothetical protein